MGQPVTTKFELTVSRVLDIPSVKVIGEGIQELSSAPGGGRIVTVEDPEGFPVSFVYGQSRPETVYETPEKLALNDETNKPRQRKFQRFEPGPAEVYKVSE